MKEKLDLILSTAKADILSATNVKELNDVKVKYQGKNGEITKLMQGMRDIPKEDRPAFGKLVNDLRTAIDECYDARETELKELELQKERERENQRLLEETQQAKTEMKKTNVLLLSFFSMIIELEVNLEQTKSKLIYQTDYIISNI